MITLIKKIEVYGPEYMGIKGRIRKGYDADLCLLDKNTLEINTVIAKGKTMVRGRKINVYGTFENP